jgi:hypothetical protein
LEVQDDLGNTPIMLATNKAHLECMRVLIEAKADVHARNHVGWRALHGASHIGHTGCLKLLINEGADMNARDNDGVTPVMIACYEDKLTSVQLLLSANADIALLSNTGKDALHWTIRMPPDTTAHRVPGMPFSVLSCNTNATDIVIDENVTQHMVDGHIAEYKLVHDFIDEHHNILSHALSRDVQVDRRVGLGENGIYQEPLERVMEYMGMSMNVDQVVNRSIDGDIKRRALLPGNVLEANHWHEQYTTVQLTRQLEEHTQRVQAARQTRRNEGGY